MQIVMVRNRTIDLIPQLQAMSDERLAQIIDAGIFRHPAVIYLTFIIHHGIHHRGWLCAYLRPMGAKVPAIYGPSHDEAMRPSAGTS
jgi:uncharacterized damage-inducible protein DinB